MKKQTMNILQEPNTINLIGIGARGLFALLVLLANNITLMLAGVSLLIPLLALAINYKWAKVKAQSKIGSIEDNSNRKLAIKNDSISRYFSNEGNVNHIHALVNEFLAKNQPFLQQKYSLKQLAMDLDIPLHYLSAFINRYYEMNYNDFINRCRVRVGAEMIRNGECTYKTIEAISSECGFNNRNTFSIAFKKETGKSPSEFLKEIKNDRHTDKLIQAKFERRAHYVDSVNAVASARS